MFDELADEATAAGVPGFEKGKAVVQDYLNRIYRYPFIKGKTLREVPTDMIEHVDSRIYFRHLQARKYANRVAQQQDPMASEAVNLYLRGMARKRFMEPALEEGERIARTLDSTKQKYWGDWKRLLKGQRVKEGQSLDAWINRARSKVQQSRVGQKSPQALKNLGNAILPINSATKSALAFSRMWIRGILGFSIGSMTTNLSQSINTASREGIFNTLKGFMWYRTKEGRALTKKLQLGDDFRAVMEKDLPSFSRMPAPLQRATNFTNARLAAASDGAIQTLDDIVMSTMLYAENTNRGIAFWSGISRKAKELGVDLGRIPNLDDLPEKVKRQLMHAGLETADETQFIYGVMGTAPRFSGPMGRILLTLSSFAPKQAAFLIRLLKEDPTGITRMFALSGFLTRMTRETMGIDTASIWGFGFIPPEVETFPFTSPQIQLGWNAVKYFANDPSKGGDPFERERALTKMVGIAGMLIPGPLGIPQEAIPLEVQNQIPALRQDIGSRAFRNARRLFEQAAEGVVRGKNEKFIRTTGTQESLIRAFGMQPEMARRHRELQSDIFGAQREATHGMVNLRSRAAALMSQGQTEEAVALLAKAVKDGKLTEAELLRPGSLQRLPSDIESTQVDQLMRSLQRSPGLAAREDLHVLERMEQFEQ